jgi:hypothetical protein
MRLGIPSTAVLLAAAMFVARPSSAQTDNKIAIGANIEYDKSEQWSTHPHDGPGILFRLGHAQEGWGLRYGLNWYSAHLTLGSDTAIERNTLGELHVRPFMGGVGYTHMFGRGHSVAFNLLGGYALTGFAIEDPSKPNPKVFGLTSHSSATPVIKPEVSIWVDLSRKFGANFSTGYMYARPKVTVATPSGQDVHAVRADMLMVKFGVVYKLF